VRYIQRQKAVSRTLEIICKRASVTDICIQPAMIFLCEQRRAFYIFAATRSTRTVYANYLLQTHPSLFSLLDGHAISFNSPTKFVGKSRPASERARRRRIDEERGYPTLYIHASVRLHFVEIFRMLVLSLWNWQCKNNEPYPAPAVVRISDARA